MMLYQAVRYCPEGGRGPDEGDVIWVGTLEDCLRHAITLAETEYVIRNCGFSGDLATLMVHVSKRRSELLWRGCSEDGDVVAVHDRYPGEPDAAGCGGWAIRVVP